MGKRLAAGWAILALLCGFAYNPFRYDPYNIKPVYGAMLFPGVITDMEWRWCGEVNAYYSPKTQTVTMCNELRVLTPGFIRFAAAHELAHGVLEQRSVSYVGYNEWAADELAAFVLILMGNKDDVMAAAAHFINQARPEDPYDVHLGDMRRGIGLFCMVATHDEPGKYGGCAIQWPHVLATWTSLLDLH